MKSSYHLEPEGLTRGIKFLESQALVVESQVLVNLCVRSPCAEKKVGKRKPSPYSTLF